MLVCFVAVDTNLIQLDTDEMGTTSAPTYADNDDDLIFEVAEIIYGALL